jgi:spore germination cell wall hydrolase CwlJ-like protein
MLKRILFATFVASLLTVANIAENPATRFESAGLGTSLSYKESLNLTVPEKVEHSLTNFDEKQIKCLTDNLYFEARGEPRNGKIAVVDVVFNRAKSSKFPNTPCEVVYQRNRRGCQFSWTCSGRSKAIRNHELYKDLEELTTELYMERDKAEVTRGATYYHANYVRPRWATSFSRTATFGNHTFYRE